MNSCRIREPLLYQFKLELLTDTALSHALFPSFCPHPLPEENLKTLILCSIEQTPVVCYFWPGLGLPRPKAIVVIPQNQPLPKHLRKKTSKSAKHACHYATKERPVKITMYLGLDIIIKIKFTTIFDRCATLNVLNYLTKNFES